jgi:hypothetical protein
VKTEPGGVITCTFSGREKKEKDDIRRLWQTAVLVRSGKSASPFNLRRPRPLSWGFSEQPANSVF